MLDLRRQDKKYGTHPINGVENRVGRMESAARGEGRKRAFVEMDRVDSGGY